MIRFVVALAPEADALIRRYRMEPCEGAFPWFRSEEAALAISGVGKMAAAAAASYLHARTGEEPLAVWVNFGTAGHRDRPLGDVLLAHTVTDAASGKRFHPPRLDGPELDCVEVLTVDRRESEFESNAAYDMEAYGFVASALRFSTSELVQPIKIVSDNRDTTTAAWTAAAVRDLVESRLDVVAKAADRFREIAEDLEPLRREETQSRAALAAYTRRVHFTVSESRRLRRLLQRWAALEPEAARESAEGSSASDILERLEQRVHALALERPL
jgi:adenosylhomocysteine nucleosidase